MNKLEILAPAGSKESFIAAVEAGADAIYCGLDSFSARSKAGNFTPGELYNYINYAHSKNVKVYIAFNTLIKQSELKDAIKYLSFISAAKADGIIIQDLGILNIARKHFSNLKLHASTQMAIHNSCGARQAQKLGFKRVVLARELSLHEISEIAKKSDIELEVFAHGALCFSVSGICLMSSFIGGHSGNRGNCAQPCRRKWSFKNKNGFYFSPKDLQLAEYISELKKSGVKSLKIEGRMKNPQYVYKTVKAYKMLAGADENNFNDVLVEASKTLARDFARSKTSFNFIEKSKDIFSPEISKQIGLNLGKIISVDGSFIVLKTEYEINLADGLKAVDFLKDESFKINIIGIDAKDGVCAIETDSPRLKKGMDVFKISDGVFAGVLKDIVKTAKIEKAAFEAEKKEIKVPLFKSAAGKDELFIRIDDIEWKKFLPANVKIIYSLSKENIAQAQKLKDIGCFELPAYIDECDLPLYQKTVNELAGKNDASFFINNISQLQFFKREADIIAGQFLYCMNSFSADFLLKNNIKGFVLSWEDDFKNIAELSKAGLGSYAIFYLSGFPVLAVSKMEMHKDVPGSELLKSSKDVFKIVQKSDAALILPEYPVMLFNKKRQLKKNKINKFAVDLSFIPPNKNYINAVLDAFNGKRPLQNEFEFNFERGLK